MSPLHLLPVDVTVYKENRKAKTRAEKSFTIEFIDKVFSEFYFGELIPTGYLISSLLLLSFSNTIRNIKSPGIYRHNL